MDTFEKNIYGEENTRSQANEAAQEPAQPAAPQAPVNQDSQKQVITEAASDDNNSTVQTSHSVYKADEKAQNQTSVSSPIPNTYGQYGTHPQQNTLHSEASGVGAQRAKQSVPYSAPGSSVSWNAGAPSAQPAGTNHYGAPPVPPAPPKKKSGKAGKIAIGLAAVFVIGLLGGFCGAKLTKSISGSTGDAVIYQSDTKTSDETDSTGSAKNTNTVESVASDTATSVVEVKTSYVQKGTFFGDYVTSGAGSGVIISKDGYIVTNNHVINGAKDITVTLKSGKEYTATLVGTDDKTDIAVLKIDATDLTPATFGDSSAVAVGEQIVVVGNPLGITMTLLQIDAAVNPGNSGGALFNLNGELIGVVNAKYSSEEVEGLGFAIPIATAKATIEDIIEYGYVKGRAQLGITAMEISDLQTAVSSGVTELGVYVYNVNSGSGAEKAGLQRGDRLVKIDDTEISSYAKLTKLLEGYSVGDTVSVTYSRDGKQKTVDVELIEYKPTKQAENSGSNQNQGGLIN